MTTAIAVTYGRIGPRGGLPNGYMIDDDLSPNGMDELRGVLSRNFDGEIESCHIRGALDSLGRSDVREFSMKNGERLVLVESQLVRKYWGSVAVFVERQIG